MIVDTDTIRRLAEMSDVAAFERIAAAVLRAANPLLYSNLAHPGVQPGGKTVKAPFDNIGWVKSAEGTRFVCAAHTTEQNDLAGKWLHDPATVTPKKPGRKPTKPAGDLVKGISEIRKLREAQPGLAVTFALTTNRETSLELSVSVEMWAKEADIDLDVWPVSRLAHFLDTNPTGQIIRRNCLGIPVKLLSRQLLLEMGKRSIQDHLSLALRGECIRRNNFVLGHGDMLVVGSSGMGKTTVCTMALDELIDKGGPAVVLKTEFIVAAATMEEALEGELRRQEPGLEARAGVQALSLCTEDEPLMVLMEDVNRTNNPGLLLNKVLSWTRVSENDSQRLWRVICPVWPRHLDAIEDQKRVFETVTVLRIDRYSTVEAIQAVRKRAKILGLNLDEHRAKSIAERLGLDPLLIGLYDLVSGWHAADIIQSYVEERLRIVASQTQRTKSELVQALHQLLHNMLQHRAISPRWGEVRSWISDQDVISLLRHIALEGSVMSYAGGETIEFRHDRVMYSLFSVVVADMFKSNAIPDYITDPFFAEMIADAAVKVIVPQEQLLRLMDESPAIGAHALKLASELDSNYEKIAMQALSQWLQQEKVKADIWANRRYAVARVLSETTAPQIRALIAQFPSGDHMWDPLLAAAFRNGNVGAGLQLMFMYEIGVTVAGKQSLLALVKRIFGHNLISVVEAVLRRTYLNQFQDAQGRVGALRLAGYLGESSLAEAVRVCWDQDSARDRDLRSYLFAAARCCGADPETTLGPVCDAWEALPEDADSTIGQPAERLAADNVAWEFRDYVPSDAIHYFVGRANTSKKLEWPITYMLRTVDHPGAVEQIVRYAAKSHFITVSSLKSNWERHSREMGRRMSSESKERLLRIAHDEAESDSVRQQAFSFWGLTLDVRDLEVIRRASSESILRDRALWMRARLQDRSVIPEVLGRISEDPEHWLHIGRYLWSDALTDALDPILDQVAEEEREHTNLEYVVFDALGNVEPKRVTAMLNCRWEKLKIKPLIVQSVLLSTDPEAAALAREAFATTQNPIDLLEHFVMNVTIASNGKQRLSVLDQVMNLRPYLDHFSDQDIKQLWQACKERGWLEFCAKYLEPRMQKALPSNFVNVEALDRALASQVNGVMELYKWIEWSAARGVTRDKIILAMMNWIKLHDEVKAISIVGDIFGREANRQELKLFEEVVGERADATSIMKAIRFNVFSRTLV